MKSMNFAVLGDQGIAAGLGKRGTQTDLTLYDRKEAGTIRTWVAPNGFPAKIQPLLQAINMSEFAIFHVTALDRFAGEQIVALDILNKRTGILSHTHEIDDNALDSIINGTVMENYTRTDVDGIRGEIAKIEPVSKDGAARIAIDHCFDVKGGGTVVLGTITAGTIKKYDVLKLLPADIEVTVKSIQMHDVPMEQAACPARVGLLLKGADPKEIGRGDMLCMDDSMRVANELELDFAKVQYYKGEIKKGQMCLINVGLKIVSGRISSTSPLKVILEKPVVCDGSPCVILGPESAGIRIIGGGKII